MSHTRWFRPWRAAVVLAGTAAVMLSGCRKDDDPTGPGPDPTNYPIVSTFDGGDPEGWALDGDSDLFPREEGGNPGGYLFAIDRTEGPATYWRAPGGFLGNVSGAYGRLLTLDLVWSQNNPSDVEEVNDGDVVLRGDDLTLIHRFAEIPGTTWTSYSIRLDESGGWRVLETGEAATAGEIQAVLSNLREFRIRGEFRQGPEDFGLDNVRFGAAG